MGRISFQIGSNFSLLTRGRICLKNPSARFIPFAYEDLLKRAKVSLDIFWLKDESLEDSANLPEPDVIAAEIADDLQAALDQFAAIATDLKRV